MATGEYDIEIAVPAAEPLGDGDDGLARGVYHFLDMGRLKYGECTVATFGKLRVLIDGGHSRDFAGQEDTPSIPEQLRQIFDEEPPHRISLLVVTHCHDDHVGCLDQLLAKKIIEPEWALITHPKLGFGRGGPDDGSHDDLRSLRTKILTAALREEDATDLTDDELQDFLDSAGTVEDRYKSFVSELKARKVKIIEYDGSPLHPELVQMMTPSGMTLIGPTSTQLIACAQQISTTNKEASDHVAAVLSDDDSIDNVALYRRVVMEENELDGRNPRGSGMNCQSITLAFGPKASRALLAGDMQFTEPGVDDADDEMRALRAAVAAEGPFKLFKTTHHTSHNGQDLELLEELGNPSLIVHSGGLNDPHHPDAGTLRSLKKLAGDIFFARTDRNGLITVRPSKPLAEAIEVSRGKLNNFSDNIRDSEAQRRRPERLGASVGAVAPVARPREPASASVAQLPPAPLQGAQIVIVNLPSGPADLTVAGIDIVVRVPGDSALSPRRVSDAQRSAVQLGGGRTLPPLLFVTNSGKLATNIGQAGAAAVMTSIKPPHCLLNVQGSLNHVLRAVRDELNNGSYEGIVLLGGYDVIPAVAADVLPARLRQSLPIAVVENELDEFLIWSDELYGDTDEDSIGELPVSRIPDGKSFALLAAALSASAPMVNSAFGIRNVARPFAEKVWELSGSREPLKVSETFESAHVLSDELAAGLHYHMLHGDNSDAREFTGERINGGHLIAFTVDNVPARFNGVVVSGCCWGALSVRQKASDVDEGDALDGRSSDDSIALRYLASGANAFIGCTGAHYSGSAIDVRDNLALEFHQLLLDNLVQKELPPARALHEARVEFSSRLASASGMEPLALARRLKNRSQFTCLGLGW